MEMHAIFLQLHTAIAAKYKTATHLQHTLSELSFGPEDTTQKTLRPAVVDHAIYLTTLYDIILQ
jgi:hypothetical protein